MNRDQVTKRTFAPLRLYAFGGAGALVLAAWAVRRGYPTPLTVILVSAGIAAIVYGFLLHARSSRAAIILASPATLGGELRGRVVSGVLAMPEEVKVALRCIHEWTDFGRSSSLTGLLTDSRRRTRYSRREHETVWEETSTVPRKSLSGSSSGFSVPFAFTLPPDGHRSGYMGDDRYRWELATSASIPGVDFHATFEVKVS